MSQEIFFFDFIFLYEDNFVMFYMMYMEIMNMIYSHVTFMEENSFLSNEKLLFLLSLKIIIFTLWNEIFKIWDFFWHISSNFSSVLMIFFITLIEFFSNNLRQFILSIRLFINLKVGLLISEEILSDSTLFYFYESFICIIQGYVITILVYDYTLNY